MRSTSSLALLLFFLAWTGLSGCGQEDASELLVTYSADCQAYLEPCG
ncbi:MAG: hypothetical protein JSW67_11900 [Candidatus Latescibacterota bacterium]|nr:MAG: hypothetical protein JSW67_11900 [Candidatus Latescibacterota bacterium]